MNTAFRSEQFLSITAILMSAFSTTFYLEFGRKHRGLNEEMVQIVLIFILQILFFLLISKRHFRVAQSDVKNVAMICLPSLCLVGFGDIKAIGMILVILGCFAISNTLSIKAVSRTITCLVLINIFAQLYSTIFSATEIFGIEMSTKLQYAPRVGFSPSGGFWEHPSVAAVIATLALISQNIADKKFNYFLFIVISISLFLANSRIGFLLMMAYLMFCFLKFSSSKIAVGFFAIGVMSAILFLLAVAYEWDSSSVTSYLRINTNNGRLVLWSYWWDDFITNPVGYSYGIGNAGQIFRDNGIEKIEFLRITEFQDFHNNFISKWYEGTLVYVIAHIISIIWIFRNLSGDEYRIIFILMQISGLFIELNIGGVRIMNVISLIIIFYGLSKTRMLR